VAFDEQAHPLGGQSLVGIRRSWGHGWLASRWTDARLTLSARIHYTPSAELVPL
jgi:hypothetical protein